MQITSHLTFSSLVKWLIRGTQAPPLDDFIPSTWGEPDDTEASLYTEKLGEELREV